MASSHLNLKFLLALCFMEFFNYVSVFRQSMLNPLNYTVHWSASYDFFFVLKNIRKKIESPVYGALQGTVWKWW